MIEPLVQIVIIPYFLLFAMWFTIRLLAQSFDDK